MNPNPRHNSNPRQSSKSSLSPRLVPSTNAWLCGFMNPNPRRNPNSSVTLTLAYLLQLHGPWSSGLCGFLNPKPRQNPNPRCNADPRQSSKSLMGVRLLPSRKMWMEPCCSSPVFPLASFL
ncbi:hypothetical protein Nmel_005207 [Mimus melanotis]